MDFYRVEQPDGTGPYHHATDVGSRGDAIFWAGESSINELVSYDDSWVRHPRPSFDGINRIVEEEKCGFDTPAALLTWFGGMMEALEQAGFLIYRYDVANRRDGGRQSVAMIDDLHPVAQWAPTQFDNALVV